MTARGFVVAAGLALAAQAAGASSLVLRPEPGIAREGGGALLPFAISDPTGVTLPVRSGEVLVETDAGEVLAADLVSFVGPGAETSSVHVLVDPSALRGQDLAAWAAELASFLESATGTESRGVAVAGKRFAPIEAGGADEIRSRLEEAGDGPLWDRTLAALDRLSHPSPAARRVLVLVTNGEESKESRHPAATCADAADSARVCVWVLVPGAPPAAARTRLATIAERTGGTMVEAGGRGPAVLPSVVARIRAAQALRLPRLPGPAPLAVSLRTASGSTDPARVWIRARRPLGLTGRPFPWVPFAAALLAAVLAGGVAFARHLPVGYVRALSGTEGGARVTRAGLTIGGAVGNGFVVPHPRVSRSHAVIRPEGGRVVLVDLRSANGTKVNGRPVSSTALRDGDRILLADAVELLWEQGGFRFSKRD